MNKIKEVIVESAKVVVDSTFLLKIKIDDPLILENVFITENGVKMISEDNKMFILEEGE